MFIKFDDKKSDFTCVFFTGHKKPSKEEMAFEWQRSTDFLPINRIFVMDANLLWYHDAIENLTEELKKLLGDSNFLTVGASMGAYGALLYAHLLNGSSLVFSPQTIITWDFVKRKDGRWADNLYKVNQLTEHPEYLDISFIQGKHHHIHYSVLEPMDKFHAERMNVTKIPYEFEKHNLAGSLKDEGKLSQIIIDRIEGLRHEKSRRTLVGVGE